MQTFYLVKIKKRVMNDKGVVKPQTIELLFDAVSYTDAETHVNKVIKEIPNINTLDEVMNKTSNVECMNR